MADRNFVILRDTAVEGIEPEVAQAMRVPALRVPRKDEFRGAISADEIADLAKRDQKTILKMSVMEQWNDWQTDRLVEVFDYVRKLEAEIIRRRIEQARLKEEQKRHGWKLDFAKWLAVTVGAGLIAAGFRWLFGR